MKTSEHKLEYNRQWRKRNKETYRQYMRNYYAKKKQEILAQQAIYREENRDKRRILSRKSVKAWRRSNPDKVSEYNSRKKNRLNRLIFANIHNSIRNPDMKRHGGWESRVGWAFDEFKKRFEMLFADWMTWDNHGEWEIDHIRPIYSFNFESSDDHEFKECWSLRNLRPLARRQNQLKGVLSI